MNNIRKVLFTFDSFVNTDIGLAKLIKEKYKDNDMFESEIFDLTTDELIDLMLLNEKDSPMHFLLTNEALKNIDVDYFYESFINNEKGYKDILERSMFNNVLKLIMLLYHNGEITPTILCENSLQENFLLKSGYLQQMNIDIHVCDINKYDFSSYNALYVGKINKFQDVIENKKLENKLLYIMMAYYNTVRDKSNKDEETSDRRELPSWLLINFPEFNIKFFDAYTADPPMNNNNDNPAEIEEYDGEDFDPDDEE